MPRTHRHPTTLKAKKESDLAKKVMSLRFAARFTQHLFPLKEIEVKPSRPEGEGTQNIRKSIFIAIL